jgi:hypothetical protein
MDPIETMFRTWKDVVWPTPMMKISSPQRAILEHWRASRFCAALWISKSAIQHLKWQKPFLVSARHSKSNPAISVLPQKVELEICFSFSWLAWCLDPPPKAGILWLHINGCSSPGTADWQKYSDILINRLAIIQLSPPGRQKSIRTGGRSKRLFPGKNCLSLRKVVQVN